MPINYDKFDKIASDYERDDEEEIKAKKDAAPERKMKLMAQHDAMFMMIGWLAKAVPSLDNVETTRLVKYIATCDKVVTENRKTRLNGVADFVRTDCADKEVERDERSDNHPCDEEERIQRVVVTLGCDTDADDVHGRVGHIFPRVPRARNVQQHHRRAKVVEGAKRRVEPHPWALLLFLLVVATTTPL